MKKFDVLVLGAGLAGLSTAYHLARKSKKKILLLEWESRIGGHASGRNAGMIRQTVPDPHIARLAVQGRKALERAQKTAWRAMPYQKNGSLLVAQSDKIPAIEAIRKNMDRLGVKTFSLSNRQISARVPILEKTAYAASLFCPSDALLETRPLLLGFFSAVQKMGVEVRKGISVRPIEKSGEGFIAEFGSQKVFASKVVNACGAWSGLLSESFSAHPVPLVPYRRHLYWTAPVSWGQGVWPFVWDLSLDFYFRPEGRGLLLSPCDKVPVSRAYCERRKEEVDPKVLGVLRRKMKTVSPKISQARIIREKSGLRTMAPDGKFVIGEDALIKNFYWVGGLGGHGVTTCFSAGELAGDIILDRGADAELVRAFSPKRFAFKK